MINDSAIHIAIIRYSLLPSKNIVTTFAIIKYGIILKITFPTASTTLHTQALLFCPAHSSIQLTADFFFSFMQTHSLTIILLRQSKLVLANLSIINKMAHRHKPPYFIILKSLFIFSWEFDIPQSLPATSLKFP